MWTRSKHGSLIDLRQVAGTITVMNSALPTINSATDVPITLLGAGPTAITISGNHQFRVLDIAGSETARIEGVTIANGSVSGTGDGAGIQISSGTLSVYSNLFGIPDPNLSGDDDTNIFGSATGAGNIPADCHSGNC